MELKVNEFITVNSSIPLRRVLGFIVGREINAHGYLKMEGEIPYEQAMEYYNRSFCNMDITISMACEGEENTLFNGAVSKLDVEFEGETAKVYIEGKTATWKLDIQKRSRSFQNTNMTYSSLIKEIAQKAGAQVITTCGDDLRIERPLIQFGETDWEFAKRCASHLNQYLISDVITGEPAFWFGMRKGKEIPPFPPKTYLLKSASHLCHSNFILKSREAHQLGDWSVFLGKHIVICKSEAEFYHGELIFYYTVCEKSDLQETKLYNENITGMELCGIVKQISGENVALELDIDDGTEENLYMYPWRPETGNIMYAMPEIGCPVLLTISSHDEREAVATSCLHRQSARKNSKFYQERSMNTTKSKICLYPEKLGFYKNNHRNVLILDDEEGITIESNKRAELIAGGNIRLKADRIMINATEEIKGVVG